MKNSLGFIKEHEMHSVFEPKHYVQSMVPDEQKNITTRGCSKDDFLQSLCYRSFLAVNVAKLFPGQHIIANFNRIANQ